MLTFTCRFSLIQNAYLCCIFLGYVLVDDEAVVVDLHPEEVVRTAADDDVGAAVNQRARGHLNRGVWREARPLGNQLPI